MSESVFPNSDLDGTACAGASEGGTCFNPADILVQLKLRPALEAGAVANQTLAVPLCLEHAQYLRWGAELIDIDTGLAK